MSRERLFQIVVPALAALIVLAIAEWLLGWRDAAIAASSNMDPGLVRYDPDRGWRLAAGWTGRHRHHDFDVTYTIDAHGARAAPVRPGVRPRVALLGDSFVFGLGVADDATFAARLGQRNPARDYLNLAVPGYSTDQQLLQLPDVLQSIEPESVWVFVYLGNDTLDNPRGYPLQADHAKPVFTLDAGRLRLGNVPVPLAAKPAALRSQTLEDAVFGAALDRERTQVERLRLRGALLGRLISAQQFDPQRIDAILSASLTEALELQVALLARMAEVAGSRLTVFLLPGASFVDVPTSASALFQDYLRRALLERQPATLVDLATDLRGRCIARACFHPNEGHYSPAGHLVIAELLEELRVR